MPPSSNQAIASMGIRVVQASSTHADTIAKFNQLMALETENKSLKWETIHSGVLAMLKDASLGFYLVAIDDSDEIRGCLAVTFEWSDWRNGLFWWIQSVYVDSAYRGRGVFSDMYQNVKLLATQATGVCGIRLYVEKENTRAMNTYLKLGMIETHYRLMEDEF